MFQRLSTVSTFDHGNEEVPSGRDVQDRIDRPRYAAERWDIEQADADRDALGKQFPFPPVALGRRVTGKERPRTPMPSAT